MKRFHSCNVLQLGTEGRRLWRFGFNDDKAVPMGEDKGALDQALPSTWVGKDLRTLWQRRINLGWFPPENVFLRVIRLPACEPAELPAMVELQLEKLSPLPVAQIVWAAEPLRETIEGMQTVVVVIAARAQVEELLGRLERKGFQADRLEIPVLHQLAAIDTGGEGLWLFPEAASGDHLCLAAWWSGGILHNLTLLRVAEGPHWESLVLQQLTQTAWAGQMEGWWKGAPACHLVTDAATAPRWEAVLRGWASAVEVRAAHTPAELAALNVVRLGRDEARINLLPAEYATRFRQQLIDRIWMGGLFAVMGLYVVGVLIYFAALEVLHFQKSRVNKAIAQLTPQYTNAMQLRERLRVIQEQVTLKFAVLDCWKAACVELPAELTLTSFSLLQGKILALNGNARPGDEIQIQNYNEALARYRVGDTNPVKLFRAVKSAEIRDGPGGTKTWGFQCELNGKDLE